MKRNFYEDRMNDLYCSVQDGNLENFYALEEYLSERGYREGFLGLEGESLLEDPEGEGYDEDGLCWVA